MTKKMPAKINYLLLLCSIIAISLFPLGASAQIVSGIVGALLFIPSLLVAIVLALLILLTGFLTWVSGLLMDWIIGPTFVSLSFTRPCPPPNFVQPLGDNCNPIIGVGLNITQDFVNLVLVVFLVVIALSIALRIGEYGSKKTFAKLILVALLVNFAPVFVGLIVDAANIVMNFFLSGTGASFGEGMSNVNSLGVPAAKTLFGGVTNLDDKMGLLAQGAAQVVLNIAFMLVFLLFAGLFLVRYVMLWVLTILAPLAFVFWVLPATKRLFDMWWKNLIQWSVIGIPIAFFLYLAGNAFVLLQRAFITQNTLPGVEPGFAGWFGDVFPYFVIVIFMVLGFTVGLTTGAMGAAATLKALKVGGAWAGARGLRGVRAGYRRAVSSRMAERLGIKERAERQAAARYTMPQRLRDMPGMGGRTLRGLWYGATAPVLSSYWALRRGIGEAALRAKEGDEAEIKRKESEYKGSNAERKVAVMRDRSLGWEKRIGALRAAIEDEQINDVRRIIQNLGGNADQELTNIGRAALRVHPDVFKPIRETFSQLAEDMGKGFSESIQKQAKVHRGTALSEGYSGVIEKIIKEMSPSAATKMDSSALFGPMQNPVVWESAQKNWGGSHWAQAGEAFGRKFAEHVGSEFKKAPHNFSDAAQKYFSSSPAGQSLYGT
ncbi:MAG: hypothetical protein G01um101430_78 [Parcubacteria group bacterium Gr01-1014_30]|nr:MAG: hypothetical protein G01um101430_78 [Parcubacteria group bacterium Gr01-1014_30]